MQEGQEMPLQQKQKLKEQAKSLLLKGCYKMAMNKYLRLVKQKSQGFTQREWAVLHLNLGITYQFQQKYQEAVQQVSRAIQIDPHYEKAYYRKVQILGEMGEQEKAFSMNIPAFARNKEIEELQMSFRDQYKNSMGIQALIKKVQHQSQMLKNNESLGQSEIAFIEEVHHSLYNKICVEFDVQQECNLSTIKNILSQEQDMKNYQKIVSLSQMLAKYYLILRNLSADHQNKGKYFSSFMNFIQKMGYNLNFRGISVLLCFWKTFLDENVNRWDEASKEEKELLTVCPSILFGTENFNRSFKNLLENFLKSQDKQTKKDIQKFLHVNSVFVPYRLILLKIHAQNIMGKELISIEDLDSFIDVIGQQIQNQVEKTYNIDIQDKLTVQTSLIKLLLQAYPNFAKNFMSNLQIETFGDLLKFSHILSTKASNAFEKNKNQQQKFKPEQKQTQKFKELVFTSLKSDKFINLLILQRMVSLFPKQKIKQITGLLKQDIQKINSENPQKNKRLSLKKIVYTNMLFKIDIKQTINKNNASTMSQLFKRLSKGKNKEARRAFNMLELYEAENILLNCLNSNQNILNLLKTDFNQLNTFLDITLHNTAFLSKEDVKIDQKRQSNDKNIPRVELLQLISNLLFLLIVDSQKEMQKMMAMKMGVTEEQIEKARKLQGQLANQSERKELKQLRVKFGKYLAKEGQSILTQVCSYFNNIKSYRVKQLQECSLKVAKILRDLAHYQPSRFYHSPILQFMIQPSILNKPKESKDKHNNEYSFNFDQIFLPQVASFFSTILKKSNPQILPYPLIQNMVRILEWSINNSEHQLIIFESYLSLISLSSLNGVKISLQKIVNGLFQENQYIVHGTLELMNNILLMSDSNGQNLVDEYYEFFNTNISNKPSKAIANLKNIINIVEKYVKHYREMIKSDTPLLKQQPITDYSHPYKIFGTLVSLCLVLKLTKVEELQAWQNAQDMIKRMYRKDGGVKNKDIALCMFKLVLHHYSSNTLQQAAIKKNKKWFQEDAFADLIKILEMTDKQKASKLKQTIR